MVTQRGAKSRKQDGKDQQQRFQPVRAGFYAMGAMTDSSERLISIE